MASRLFLMFNMGRSGGSWTERILNSHPDLWGLAEPAKSIGVEGWREMGHWERVKAMPQSGWYDWTLEGRQRRIAAFANAELLNDDPRAMGFSIHPCEGTATALVSICERTGSHIIQQFRHPLAVVGHRTQNLECRPERFQKLVQAYAGRYSGYLDLATTYPLIRLEDLNRSLAGDGLYFKRVYEYWTQVEWTDEQIDLVRQQVSPGKRRFTSWDEDPTAEGWWGKMSPAQQAIFLVHFEKIMLTAGYSWS